MKPQNTHTLSLFLSPSLQDDRTFLHINEWTAPGGARATNVGLLIPGAGDSQLKQPLGGAPLAPPAPVILGATNETLVPLLRRLGSADTAVPLIVYVGGNVTLGLGTLAADYGNGSAAAAARSAAPAGRGNITISRPVFVVGRAFDATSLDFRMRANQIVLAGPHANLTLDSLLLENLGYGDVISAQTADGVQLQSTFSLWAVYYNRSEPRLTLRNCTSVAPPSEVGARARRPHVATRLVGRPAVI